MLASSSKYVRVPERAAQRSNEATQRRTNAATRQRSNEAATNEATESVTQTKLAKVFVRRATL